MLREERQREIARIVDSEGQASVAGLARRFGVAEMTIRRDLDELDVQRLLRRIHGGALRAERRLAEPPVLERTRQQARAKQRIAGAVAGMVRDGETIFLGSGTTALAVAEALVGHGAGLTVVTNALTVAETLAADHAITVVVVGGFLRHSELSLIGHFAEAALRDIQVSKVIMGIGGIDLEHGLTSEHLQELMTDRAILGISKRVIVVADHTKFGHVAASRTAPAEAATMIVTDVEAPADIVSGLRAIGVQVILV